MSLVIKLMSGAIRLYQLALSPYLAMNCRFQPTCSGYARQAIERHGAVAGCLLGLRRIARCHPWGGAGHDPVPESCAEQRLSVEPRP